MNARAMGSHQSANALSETWLTPPEIIQALGPFDLDPCAAPEPRPWPTAARHIARPDDGLHAPWEGRVWLNPPYSQDAVRWLRRMAAHGHGTALVFARTETSWFWETVWQQASALLFLTGRVYFCRPSGARARTNAGAPSVLAAYGEQDASRLAEAGLAGAWARDWILTGDAVPQRQQAMFGSIS
jgi:hypothetical protein